MAYRYLNMNPKNRRVSDCTVRAFALAHDISWYRAYDLLSEYARKQCIVIDDINFIDDFLNERYEYECFKCEDKTITVAQICERYPSGIYLVTMNGHITCIINGCIYDTWDCSDRYAHQVWTIAPY